MKELPHESGRSRMDPDLRKQFANDVLKDYIAKESTAANTPEEKIVATAMETQKQIWDLTLEVVKADKRRGGAFDPNAMYDLIQKLLMDNFRTWSKDDLLFVFSTMLTELLVERAQDYHANLDPNDC